MRVKVLDRFIAKGRVIKYPGEVIDVSSEMAYRLIQRGIVEPADGQPYETTAEYAKQVLEQRAKDGDCKGCPGRSK